MNHIALNALTVPSEQQEVKLVLTRSLTSVESRIKAAVLRRRRIIFAFFQDDFQGGRVAYWHVTNPMSKSFGSTLSMEGLRDWKIL